MPLGLQYTEMARYAGQIERYLKIFPREQVKVLIFEEFFADLEAGYRKVRELLEVEPDFSPDFTVRNERHQVRSTTRQRLVMKLPGLSHPAALGNGPLARRLEQLRAGLLRYNTRGDGRSSAVPAALRRQLHGDFAEDIARLERLLDRDLTLWRRK